MFSECASSQIGSIDSYSELKEEEIEKVEVLEADLDNSDISLTGLQQGSKAGSKESILDALDFSSDEDETTGGKKKKDEKGDKKSASNVPALSCDSEKSGTGKQKSRKNFHNVAMSRFYFSSPGPAAYYPALNSVKPCAPAHLLAFRQHKKYDSLGPGPGAYLVENQCCTMQYNDSHFAKRFQDSESDGPGPAAYDVLEYCKTGKFKPKARILSRPKLRDPQICVGPIPNIYGMTRRGRARPPNAILIGKPYDKVKIEPGPGAYDPEKLKDTRVGILIRGRPNDMGMDLSVPGPKYLLPSYSRGPAWSLKARWKADIINTDSPGPIYKPNFENRKPLSMTFRPFPVETRNDDPGPLSYEAVGEQYIRTKLRAPEAIISGRDDPDFGLWRTPGPNKYFPPSQIGFTEYNMVSMKGRWKAKTSVEPGPADYDVPHIPPHCRNPPKAVFPHKDKEKKPKDSGPGFKYDPKVDRGSVRNVILAPRWRERKTVTDNVPFYDVTGFTQRGKTCRIPVSFKSRQSPFVYQGLSTTTKPRFGKKDRCNLQSLRFEKPSGMSVQ